ncbi:hypothetical protein [Methylorubrum sp. SB2]|uniref:hypothetical protein n=1 Tax=Methylorubrum subtropicum TaxID=3138812 RepID=UPI00313E0A31
MTVLRSFTVALPSNPAERRRAWAGALAPFLDMAPAERDPAPGLLALTRHRLGPLTLVEMTAPAQTFRRALRPGHDDVMVLFWLDGVGRVTWPGGTAGFGRLQGVVLDLAQAATLAVGPVRATGLVLPRALVADRVPNLASLHGAVLDPASDPVGRLFFTCVQDAAETAAGLPADRLLPVAEGVAALAAAALRRLATERRDAPKAAPKTAPPRRLAEVAA